MKIRGLFVSALLLAPLAAHAADMADPEMDELISRDIEDLIVSSVSKRDEKKNDAAAAIYVITSEDLKRSGVRSIPDALRMVPGLNVAQAASNRWAVSARGFNGVLASKLLVLIDGRTVYTPVFSGTYWDDQSTLIEDIDRIEVIRGPGASLYGANAVNGIINVITKNASATQGNYVSVGEGTKERSLESRHGGKIGNESYYRAYAQLADYNSSDRVGDGRNLDDWRQMRTGFRVDANQSSRDSYTVQGDAYGGEFGSETFLWQPVSPFFSVETDDHSSSGANILTRWNRKLSDASSLSLQTYIDHYTRIESHFAQRVTTLDMQLQHNIKLNDRNNLVWGGGARYSMERLNDTYSNEIFANNIDRSTFNIFAQNEYAVIPKELFFTLGSKLEHNDFTGIELEPSARLSWQPTSNQTVWAAVSRAVRTPSEIEDQSAAVVAVIPGAPPQGFALTGSSALKAEKLTGYELGYRIQPRHNLSFDTAVFYNKYTELESFGPFGSDYARDGTLITRVPFINTGEGTTRGIEIAADWRVTDRWRLNSSYSHLRQSFSTEPGTLAPFYSETSAPRNQFSVRSYYNIASNLQWDNMLYYVGRLDRAIKSYVRYDTRLAWQVSPTTTLSLLGQNLLTPQHKEFGYSPAAEIDRSLLARAVFRF